MLQGTLGRLFDCIRIITQFSLSLAPAFPPSEPLCLADWWLRPHLDSYMAKDFNCWYAIIEDNLCGPPAFICPAQLM